MREKFLDAEQIKQHVVQLGDKIAERMYPLTYQELQRAICGPLEKWVDGKANRRLVTEYLFGVPSTKNLSVKQLAGLFEWMALELKRNGMEKKCVETMNSMPAKAEAQTLLTAALKMKGQMDLWQLEPAPQS